MHQYVSDEIPARRHIHTPSCCGQRSYQQSINTVWLRSSTAHTCWFSSSASHLVLHHINNSINQEKTRTTAKLPDLQGPVQDSPGRPDKYPLVKLPLCIFLSFLDLNTMSPEPGLFQRQPSNRTTRGHSQEERIISQVQQKKKKKTLLCTFKALRLWLLKPQLKKKKRKKKLPALIGIFIQERKWMCYFCA